MKKQKTRYPGVTRLENGKFELRVKIINPKTGKEKDIKRVVAASSAGAAATIREELRQSGGPAPQTARPRLDDYATSWLKSKLKSLKPSTADRYATMLDLHIVPVLGDYYIDAIEPSDIRAWLAQQKGKPSTINGRLRILKTLLSDACYELDLARSPAQRIPALREKRAEDDPNRLEAHELATVLAAFETLEPEWHALIMVIALTGMRFGEATALKWPDIDEKGATIHVVRSQWKGKITDTKTGSSRTLPLPDILAEALRRHHERCLKERPPGQLQEWVFLSREGTHYRTPALRKPLLRVLKEVGIDRRQTTHGFRRTFNNLTRQFATGEVVRAMTGHVTEAMTEHYSHVEDKEKSAAVNHMIAAVQKAENEANQKAEEEASKEAENEAREGQVEGKVEGLVEGSPKTQKRPAERLL